MLVTEVLQTNNSKKGVDDHPSICAAYPGRFGGQGRVGKGENGRRKDNKSKNSL